MPAFTTTRRVPFTARQMFDLVADVERYPEFLPLCESLTVRERRVEGAATVLVATMGVGYRSLKESFTTRVTLRPDDLAVDVAHVDGPFSRLDNRWLFIARPGGSDVEFHIDYEFRSAMLGLLVGGLFDQAFRRFSEAFEMRARAVYGVPGTVSLARPATGSAATGG